MKKYLVTGGAGFVGSNIAHTLEVERKAKVTVLDNFSSGNYKNLSGFTGGVITGDIQSRDWFGAVGGVDAIFHEAAITDTTVMDQRKMMEVNVDGFRNVLNFALETGEKGDQGDKGDKGDDGVDGTMILSGMGDPPSPSGLADGTIYIKYTA